MNIITEFSIYIRIRLGAKLQLKLTILIVLDQICLKKGFPVWNGISIIEFCIFELAQEPTQTDNFKFLEQIAQ